VEVTPIRNPRTGSLSYRITGTIRGKQRKRQFSALEVAREVQTEWELERTLSAAAIRPKATRLKQEELTQAEAAFEMLRGTGLTVVDAVRHLLRHPPAIRTEKTFDDAYKAFLQERDGHISARQLENHKSALSRLATFLGPVCLADVTAENITAWLKSLECGKKSWNLYRSSIGAFFNWSAREPRQWIDKGPIGGVAFYRKCETLSDELPERLTVEKSRELLEYLQANRPQWVTFFAVALFAGLRPDGEVAKLADAIERDGIDRYLRGGTFYLTARITKDRRARPVPLPHNLLEWLAKYPLTPEALRAGSRDEYAAIRSRFGLPHDGLRHTSISAWVSVHGVSEAAYHHGTSERVIRVHYLSLMKRNEADAFYSIRPSELQSALPTGTDS
jgi:hypothetical protein